MEWYRLKLVGIKNKNIRKLMEMYLDWNEFRLALNRDTHIILNSLEGNIEELNKLKIALKNEKYLEFLEFLRKDNIGLITLKSKAYPEALKNITKPPLFLFYKGDIDLLSSDKIIAVVGTRKATKYGEIGVSKIVKELVESGVTIVSGLAEGIDALAHKETLKFNGYTIAVLACGIDMDYPKSNLYIRKMIEKNGVVISEFPIGTQVFRGNFPIRNRIIAGLSKGVVVIESKLRGGSLITAEIAFEEGRDVYALPGDIFSPMSKGCNELIKKSEGKLITSGQDILKEYFWNKVEKEELEVNLSGEKYKIYDLLKVKMNLEEIKNELKIEIGKLLGYLMELELDGYIQSLPAGFYRRKK